MSWREALEAYVAGEARPVDKLAHMARVHREAATIAAAEGVAYDDDVVHAAAWLHDLGVFVGHRPESLDELATWDHVTYAMRAIPAVLEQVGFPRVKIDAVVDAVRTHLPDRQPTSVEGALLRDADLLEQLGAIAILRTVSKVGRDSRFPDHAAALRAIEKAASIIPPQLRFGAGRERARGRVVAMRSFLAAADDEAVER